MIKNKLKTLSIYCLIAGLIFTSLLQTKNSFAQQLKNNSERLEWYHNLGYGLFIHFGLDAQIGTVISHSLVGASDDYVSRYFNNLPKTFYPDKFDADHLALEAKINGIKYVVFTAKHHSGFCMFDTRTTDFNITNTPYKRDMTREIVDAFRKQGIAIGVYFSPDDFNYLYRNNVVISRDYLNQPSDKISGLIDFDKQQLNELLHNYGKIDILFIDGPNNGAGIMRELTRYAWQQDPEIVITRGAMTTPEISPSTTSGLPISKNPDVWEACYTMGTSWQYKPTNEKYLTAKELINDLIQIRALNGNMLLNIGPKPSGEIAGEQLNILREIGTWLFINGEAIYNVSPYKVNREENIWFTKNKDDNSVYAFVTNSKWDFGTQKSILLKSVIIDEDGSISILGQNDKVLEYHPEVTPKTKWKNTSMGLLIDAYRAQRVYNDRKWPNPVVLKIRKYKQ